MNNCALRGKKVRTKSCLSPQFERKRYLLHAPIVFNIACHTWVHTNFLGLYCHLSQPLCMCLFQLLVLADFNIAYLVEKLLDVCYIQYFERYSDSLMVYECRSKRHHYIYIVISCRGNVRWQQCNMHWIDTTAIRKRMMVVDICGNHKS